MLDLNFSFIYYMDNIKMRFRKTRLEGRRLDSSGSEQGSVKVSFCEHGDVQLGSIKGG
jgi:hypothetical protein